MSQFITLNTVIGNGKSYQVPIYQRDYAWEKEDWEDLWNDIQDIPTDGTHYLGYLVLQPIENGDGEAYWVIDGQQRLTTLSILALAVTALFKHWADNGIDTSDNNIRLEKITERYLGNFSTSKLSISPKISLNRNNDDYYKSWLLKYRQSAALSKLKPSQQLMQKAFNYYLEQLKVKFKDNTSGAALADFLEKTVGNGIVFTQIIVSNDLDAFKVFETLNARGVKLSTADLLKNHLFKLTHKLGELDLDEAERRWQNITDTIRSNDLTTFIRHYWNIRVLDLLKVSTCYPLMIAAFNYLPRKEFKTLLRELAVITFRYNISDLNPNDAERAFGKVASEVAAKQLTSAKSTVMALKNIYVPDGNFEQAFSTVTINTRRKKDLAKYILVKIENQLSGKDNQPEEAVSTIEHILPENPGANWETFFAVDIQDDYKYRLGNYTLLEASTNNKLDNNTAFGDKLAHYKESAYTLSNEYCNYERFTPKEIALRQEKMARIAKSVWKSAFIPSMD